MSSLVLLVSLGLVQCSPRADCPHEANATWSAVEDTGVPTYEWPESNERPEKTDPPHGEGSGDSVLFVGLHSNISNTANTVIVDSSVSGFEPLPPVTWLPNGLNLVTTALELVKPFPPATPNSVVTLIRPDTTKHLANSSTVKERRSYTRRTLSS
jgi:hypothetical protein